MEHNVRIHGKEAPLDALQFQVRLNSHDLTYEVQRQDNDNKRQPVTAANPPPEPLAAPPPESVYFEKVQAATEAQQPLNNIVSAAQDWNVSLEEVTHNLQKMKTLAQEGQSEQLGQVERERLQERFSNLAGANHRLLSDTSHEGQRLLPPVEDEMVEKSPTTSRGEQLANLMQDSVANFDGYEQTWSVTSSTAAHHAIGSIDKSLQDLEESQAQIDAALEFVQDAEKVLIKEVSTFSNFSSDVGEQDVAKEAELFNRAEIQRFAFTAVHSHDGLDAERIRNLVF